MATTYGLASPTDHPAAAGFIRTARTTGLFYLAFFITGIAGSMLVRGQIFATDDAQATLSTWCTTGRWRGSASSWIWASC